VERAGALKVLWFETVVRASGLDAPSFFALSTGTNYSFAHRIRETPDTLEPYRSP